MAGDWIKMRLDLQSHPKVVRILSALRPQNDRIATDKFRVIGGLHAVWSVFDVHSEDGVLHGYTPELMDHIIGWPGFSAAMISVGWLRQDGEQALIMPEFSEHNGKSAKRRAEDQKRKRGERKSPQSVRTLSAERPAESGPEKRREEKKEEYTAHPKSRRKPQTALPQDFELDEGLRGYAEKHLPQVDADKLFESFCENAEAKSWAYSDWRKAWQVFCRNCAPDSGHWAAGQYPRLRSKDPTMMFGGKPVEWQ